MIPKITRATATPSRWTFTIPPISDLIARYVLDGKGWIDPFSGMNSPVEWTNDLNPQCRAEYHLQADAFCKMMPGPFNGVLFDPPYSYRQIKECYEKLGLEVSQLDTSTNFYNRVKNAICDKIATGGYALSFGWDSSGFGKNRGFQIIEVLLVNHGQHHHDTICTVEKKVQRSLRGAP